MVLLTRLMELAIRECYMYGKVPWGESGFPDSFITEATIEYHRSQYTADFAIIIAGVYILVDASTMSVWHSRVLDSQDVFRFRDGFDPFKEDCRGHSTT